MLPELTKGALDRIIMAREDIEGPIFQLLGHKRLVSSTGNERYRILLSDGVKSNSFVVLVRQLNELITQGVLSDLSIVKIERYAVSMVKHNDIQRPVIVILNIDILVPGHEVGKVLAEGKVRAEVAGSEAPCQANADSSSQKKKMLPELTKGALDRIIVAREEIKGPIFQLLGHKRLVSSTVDERYRILVSDGVKSNSFVMLAPQLNELITQGVLSDLSIVKIERYAISMVKHNDFQRPVIVILNINVLVPGCEVGKVLGPISLDKTRVEEPIPIGNRQASAGRLSRSGDELDAVGTIL